MYLQRIYYSLLKALTYNDIDLQQSYYVTFKVKC